MFFSLYASKEQVQNFDYTMLLKLSPMIHTFCAFRESIICMSASLGIIFYQIYLNYEEFQ
jgi:hypothetical protein